MPATTQYDVVLDGQGYVIDPASYHKRPATRFAAKVRSGSAGYEDFINSSAWSQTTWREGTGNVDFDSQHPKRFANGEAIDPSFGDMRLGKALASVFATETLYAFATWRGVCYGISESSGKVYSSTDGSTWALAQDLNTISAVTSLRSIYAFGGGTNWASAADGVFFGAGNSGKVFRFDGAAWTLWNTVASATSIRSLGEGNVPTIGAVLLVGASFAVGAQLGYFTTAPTWAVLQVANEPNIEAICLHRDVVYYATVDDGVGVIGNVYFTHLTAFDAQLIATLSDNAVACFFHYNGDLLAGSRTRGKVWKVDNDGLKTFWELPENAMAGTPPAYSLPIRAMAIRNNRLYVPINDAAGLCLYQYDGTGWARHATGGSGNPRGLVAFNDALVVAGTNLYRMAATYAAAGYFYTPWFDAELAGVEKTLVRVTITHAPLATGESIVIGYALDDGASYAALGTSSTVGTTVASFDFPTNTRARRVSLSFLFGLTTNTATPKLRSAVLEYQLEPDLKIEWTFDPLLDGTTDEPLMRLDESNEPSTGAALRAALWASKAKKSTVTYTDDDGTVHTVWFADLDDHKLKDKARAYAGWRGQVRLVEA